MFSERRFVVSVCRFLPLVPCVHPPLGDVGHLNSVAFESNIRESGSNSYVAHTAVHASDLVDGIRRLTCMFVILQPEHS